MTLSSLFLRLFILLSAWSCLLLPKQSPGHTHRISFSRGAHEAVALGPKGREVHRCLFTCQISRQPRLRTERTIEEHTSSVKHPMRDLLDRHLSARYTHPDNHKQCRLVALPRDRGLPAALAAPDTERRSTVEIRADWKNLGEPPVQYGDAMKLFEMLSAPNS